MIFNIHAGHNPAGKIACGAVGYLNESAENRRVKNALIVLLRKLGHTVYDCTIDDGKNQGDILTRIVKNCNSHNGVNLDVSIHLNAGGGHGVECYCYDEGSVVAVAAGHAVCEALADALIVPNRGVKFNKNLYFLKRTKAQALLIECCFVDNKDDAEKFDAEKAARAIAYAITGQPAALEPDHSYVSTDTEAESIQAETTQGDKASIYRVQVGAFRDIDYARSMQSELKKLGIESILVRA